MHQCAHILPFLPVSLREIQLTEKMLDDDRAPTTSIFALMNIYNIIKAAAMKHTIASRL